MQCGPEPEANLAKAVARVREAAEQGAQIICLPELFRSQYFCQSEDHANFALAEEIPGPRPSRWARSRARLGAVIIASLFEKRAAGSLSQYRRDHRRGWPAPREISQDAYPGRPVSITRNFISRRAILVSKLADAARQHRRLRLLGSMVSGSGPPNGSARRRDSVLSDRDRLASVGKSEIRLRPAFRLGNDAAQPRHRQWLLRRRGQSRRP